MRGEVIAIGDELVTGQRLDTNSRWLSERLCELGVRPLYHTTVGDDLAANVAVFRQATRRADIVVATGGLGPTADDLTRDAVAAMAGLELVLDEEQLRAIEAMFARRGRPMPERNRAQALFPSGSRPIANPNGTAPGIRLELPREGEPPCRLFCLPGVPAEMFEMWDATVAPAIAAAMPERRVISHRRIRCYGVGESHLEAMLPDLIARQREPIVGITVSQATITLRITASGATIEECRRAMEPTAATIYETLGTIVFGEEEDELEHAVARLLGERRLTLATAEWGSAGRIANWLGDVTAARGTYLGGVVVANAEAADRTLGLAAGRDESIAELAGKHGATSRQVAEALAVACRLRFGSEVALATSAVPDGEAETNSGPPTFHIAIAHADGVMAKAATYAGHPDILKDRGGKDALNLLRLWLLRR